MQDGDIIALNTGKLCLELLSASSSPREVLTHASGVLVSMAIAAWRAHKLWPVGGFASGELDNPVVTEDSSAAAAMIATYFFGCGGGGSSDDMGDLLMTFMPLPSYSTLAVSRAIIYRVCSSVLLCTVDSNELKVKKWSPGVCLYAGPVLGSILKFCGAACGLQLRSYALQVIRTLLVTQLLELFVSVEPRDYAVCCVLFAICYLLFAVGIYHFEVRKNHVLLTFMAELHFCAHS